MLSGPISASIRQLALTLSELVLLNNGLLRFTVVLNIAGNRFVGSLPPSISNLTSLVQLDISDNRFAGNITASAVFFLPNLQLFNYADNFFVGKPPPNTTVDVIIGEYCSSGRFQSFAPPPPGEQSRSQVTEGMLVCKWHRWHSCA
eukprot:SM000016S01960  [mRNA]  locus=s16:907432:908251:+ [translate_table: standard]